MAIETAATLLERERELVGLGVAPTEVQHGRGRVVLVEAHARRAAILAATGAVS